MKTDSLVINDVRQRRRKRVLSAIRWSHINIAFDLGASLTTVVAVLSGTMSFWYLILVPILMSDVFTGRKRLALERAELAELDAALVPTARLLR